MSIILDENMWAQEAIEKKDLGKKPSETMRRVSRYYLDQGLTKAQVRNELDKFLLECDNSASLPKWSALLDSALSRALKVGTVKIDHIPITKPEIDVIDALNGVQLRRLAFTLLCVAKYWDAVNNTCTHWVNSPDNEIMRMANINTSIKRQSLMFSELRDLGLVEFSKKVDNINVRLLYISDGDEAMSVTDFRNLGYQYLKYCGEDYYECQNCGIVTKRKNPGVGRKPKYCPECAAKIALAQRINSVMMGRRATAGC